MPFRDVLEIQVTGGNGGDGSMSFRREKYIPKGGPDGGHGGKGGSVFLRAVGGVESLDSLVGKRKYKATNGDYGSGRLKAGSDGEDIFIDVPIGTVAVDVETNRIVSDLIHVGELALVAKGGEGGRGNSVFATSRRQGPRFAELGVPGQSRKLRLELRLIADVGLVGYPNAGKSSLLKALSNANPEVAAYPFTTLSPILGVVERERSSFEADEQTRFTMADIPGIIEGASQGKGLGLEFLRHISRTRLLVWVLAADQDPMRELETLRAEVREYDPSLLENPALIALNKIDLIDQDMLEMLIDELSSFGLAVVGISAMNRTGLDEIRTLIFDLLPPQLERASLAEPEVVQGPEPVRVTVLEVHENGTKTWTVKGGGFEARVSRFARHLDDAAEYLEEYFTRQGLNNALTRAGVKAGDTVQIGIFAFEYFDDTFNKDPEPEEHVPRSYYLDYDDSDSDDLEETAPDGILENIVPDGVVNESATAPGPDASAPDGVLENTKNQPER